MKQKKIMFKYAGKKEQVGFVPVVRSLPNSYVNSVGHFVFLDQMTTTKHLTKQLKKNIAALKGKTAHPHRGIATFTYLIKGTIEHNDSAGNYGVVSDGGIQWMKAGNGIIHDEIIIPSEEVDTTLFGMQFWINLPAKNKSENSDYMAINGNEVPQIQLPNKAGNLRVLIGDFDSQKSKIPTYSNLFLYHIELKSEQEYSLSITENEESALVVVKGKATINNESVTTNELLVFDKKETLLTIANPTKDTVDLLVFGGEPYKEPIVFGGPYVMNSQEEIAQANADYYHGKYGDIKYRSKS